jgi:hypothetical protein
VTPGLKRRLPLVFVALVLAVAWSNGFGCFPSDRVVTWQFPVEYAQVRQVDLQIWRGDELVKREERAFEKGITEELRSRVPLSSGQYQALSIVTFADGGTASWTRGFTAADSVVVKP